MTTEKITVARRIRAAINNYQDPEPRDVALLRAYCPDYRDLLPDELACTVIEEMVKRNEEERQQVEKGKPLTA